MQSHYLQIVTCILVSFYLSKTKVGASIVKDNSDVEADSQQEGNINLDRPYFANFKCPQKFGAYPDVTECSKFYVCVLGFPRRMGCPLFHHFDKNRRKCLPAIMAVCDRGDEGKETTPIVKTEATVPDDKGSKEEDPEFVCPEISGSFPHSTDCSQYYECDSYKPSLKTCSDWELFDGLTKQCRPESEVSCGSRDRPTRSTSSEIITTSEETTPTPPEPTTPDLEEQTGPDTNCEEDDVDCIIKETGEIPKWYKCPEQLGSYRHPLSNKLFIFCINWKPSVKRCGQKLVYSKKLRTCVPPDYRE